MDVSRSVGLVVFLVIAAPAVAFAQAPVAGAPASSLTMQQAIDLALARNQSLRSQALNVDAARADQVTAGLKPNLTFSSVNENFPMFSPSQLTGDYLKNDANYVESLSYLFERGGKRKNRLLVASDATDITSKLVAAAEHDLRLQTAQAFIGVLLAKSTLALARQNVDDFSEIVDISQQRLTSGDLSQNDFFRISLQKLQFAQDVSAAQVQLVQAKVVLRQLVGYETVTDSYDVVGDLAFRPAPASLADLRSAALRSRPDLLAAQSNLKFTQDSVTLERSNAVRDVSGEVEYDRAGSLNALGFGFAIDLPFHDRNQGNIARAQVSARQATADATAAQFSVLSDVDAAYAVFQASSEVVSLFESGYLDQAQQSLDISQYIYQQGAGSLLDLLDAERTYRDTQVAYREALAAYMASVEQVNFAVGTQVLP